MSDIGSIAPVLDDFVDAMEHLPADQHPSHHERNYGILERCGRWLMAIPRDDVVALKQTSEYREFLSAFDKLGEAHRRTVTLERQHLTMALVNFPSPSTNNNCISSSVIVHPPSLSSTCAIRRRRFSFLQHLA